MVKEFLMSAEEKGYGANFKDHLLEQYKVYVQSAEKISDRRQSAISYFLTINAALISMIGLSTQADILREAQWVRSIIAILGMFICVIFWFLIRSYKQLNTGKFRVIHEVEDLLPLSLYKREWTLLEEGKNRKIYFPFSHVELLIPWIFGIFYLVLGFALCAE